MSMRMLCLLKYMFAKKIIYTNNSYFYYYYYNYNYLLILLLLLLLLLLNKTFDYTPIHNGV